jgi:lysozyme
VTRKTSTNGIELLKQFEGLELEAYQDIAGIWTIGYGHTGDDVKPGMRISEREAEDLLRRDVLKREANLNSWRITRGVALNKNEFDALISFIYNVGIRGFAGSTAVKRLIKDDRMGAADALTWWNKATVNGVLREVFGLTRRRAAERALFLKPINPTVFDTRESNAQPSKERRRFFQ